MKIEYDKPYFYYWADGSIWIAFTKEELEDFISDAQALLRDIDENPDCYKELNDGN